MSVNISANMNLPVPGVGNEDGPQWATDLNACLALVDAHDHSSGSGVKINPSGLDINSDISIGSTNNITNARSLRFTTQASALVGASDLRCVYAIAGDLYYNNANGVSVQITNGSGIAGAVGSISNLTAPASASYVSVSSTFVWQSAANTSANMDCGSVIFRNITASSNGITVSPPIALSSDYSIVLPSLPGSQSFMTLDASGNMAAPWTVDGSTIEVSGGATVRVKDLGITGAKIANTTITSGKYGTASIPYAALGTYNLVKSTSCGLFTGTSSSYATITNLTATITATGNRPVNLTIQSDGTEYSTIGIYFITNGGFLRIDRDGTPLAYYSQGSSSTFPANSYAFTDTPTAGSHTYTMSYKTAAGTCAAQYVQLVAHEV